MIDSYIPLILTALGGLIWLIRVEAKVLTIERDLLRIENEAEKSSVSFQIKVEKLHNDLNDIKIALARIESRMILPHNSRNSEKEC